MEEEKQFQMEIKESEAENLQNLLLKKIEKQLLFTKLVALFTGLSCAALVLVALVVVPPVMKTLSSAQAVMNTANTTMVAATSAIEAAEKSLENVEVMSDSIIDTSNQLNAFVTDNSASMTKAMDELSNVDFQGLNSAITDLQDAVGPFANMMRKFK